MMSSITRREFLSAKSLLGIFDVFKGIQSEEVRKRESLEQYFQSPLYSYPLLQEMPWELLLEEANKQGIPTEGRSKNDIARDVFSNV